MTHTYKMLDQELRKRNETHYQRYYYRTQSMRINLGAAKEYGHAEAHEKFGDVKRGTPEHEEALKYALCHSIMRIRNIKLDKEDKFDLISILIKDWRYGVQERAKRFEAMAKRKEVIKEVAEKRQTFRYPGA